MSYIHVSSAGIPSTVYRISSPTNRFDLVVVRQIIRTLLKKSLLCQLEIGFQYCKLTKNELFFVPIDMDHHKRNLFMVSVLYVDR
jgi:hypothetical protein